MKMKTHSQTYKTWGKQTEEKKFIALNVYMKKSERLQINNEWSTLGPWKNKTTPKTVNRKKSLRSGPKLMIWKQTEHKESMEQNWFFENIDKPLAKQTKREKT